MEQCDFSQLARGFLKVYQTDVDESDAHRDYADIKRELDEDLLRIKIQG